MLLATCVIAEAGIASHVGVTMQINQQANEEANARYEEYQEQQRQAQEEPAAIDYIGPNVHVKDGQVVRGALSRTATTRPVVAEPDPEQQTEPTPTPEPAEEPEAQPSVASEKPKASAETPEASDSGKKATSTPKPSVGGTGGSASASKRADTPKSSGSNSQGGTSNATQNRSGGHTIYVTPTGEKYHYSGNCNGGTYIESTLEEALSRGLEPCKKCVK